MIIVGSSNSNKSQLFVNEYIKLINKNIDPKEILILTLNSYKKDKLTAEIKAHFPTIKPNVQTFLGLCYNSILNNWEEIEKNIPYGEKKEPTLCGLEVSQNLLLEAVKKVGFKDYISKINLVHQLLRRHSLIVGNNLTEDEIKEKSEMLGEVFADDAKKVLDIFKAKTLELRIFDYLRQQSLFKYLYQNSTVFSHLKYCFIDDYDEQTPACNDFFNNIKEQLVDYVLCINPKGSTRCGYLCADLDCINLLDTEKDIIKAQEKDKKTQFEITNTSKRLEMLKECVKKTNNLINNGTSPEEISIITPLFDNQLKFTLKTLFEEYQIPIQFISGNEKLVNDNVIKSILSLLKIINSEEKNIDDINIIFPVLLKISQNKISKLSQKFELTGGFINYDFKDDKLNKKYEKFLSFVKNTKTNELLSTQLNEIYKIFIAGENFSSEQLANINFLEKQIKNLEIVLQKENKLKIITQLENSIVAENDIEGIQLKRNSIIIATPQKLADIDYKTKFQFWLDVTNDEWIKQDTGTIYNAWVFSRSWKKNTYTYEDGIKCVKNKTKRLIEKLKSLNSSKIFIMSSNYNSLGQENITGISDFFKETKLLNSNNEKKETLKHFTPRSDQKPVLEYTKGLMAVSAVPGAGKTTIMQELVSKLIDSGINAENIFVLTYMESAAKIFKERITTAYPNLNTYPNISTIHGLALRIIKENGNYVKVNLDENFEVCDELFRQRLIREVIGELGLKYDEFEKYEKGISIAKFTDIQLEPKTKELKEFISFYEAYKKKLLEFNFIDYDDMLVYAVKILEENQEILKYYQNICKYIIEDEAQDSSEIQQKLITLLSGSSKNIVRCGDINQAITSTFTNSDTQGFRNFIKNSSSVEMNQSQRCAKGIYELANKLIETSKENPEYKNAFYDIKMQSVENKNPKDENSVKNILFENETEEQNAIILEIKNILKNKPKASVAILLRNNFQVNEYINLLKNRGIETISRSDTLEQNTIFNIILSIFKFCTEPWNNSFAQNVYQNIYNIKKENIYLANLETPFITTDTTTIKDELLVSLHWELNYWLTQNSNSFEFLALKIGEYYCKTETDKSNLYIISEIIRRLSADSKSKKEIISKLEQIAKRPTIAGLKFFNETESSLSTLLGGKVQIMTMHKSKGDEFDYVFVPEFTENTLGSEIKSIKTGNFISFYESIKALDFKYKSKNALELKKEILEENLRLLYVVITRAKKKIYFSSAKKYKKFGKIKNYEPSKILEILI